MFKRIEIADTTIKLNNPYSTAAINLEKIFDEKFSSSANISDVVISDADKDYLYKEKLEKNGSGEAETENDSYKKSTSGDFFLIIKRPFAGVEKTITVIYGTTTYSLILENESKTGADLLNKGYPTADLLDSKMFRLFMPVSVGESGTVLYQWQESTNSTNGSDGYWSDIPLANTQYYYSKTTDFGNGVHWFRCVVDGKASVGVQVITPKTDKRTWTDQCGTADQCYISNGTVAYTVVDKTDSNHPSDKKIVFDVVGTDKTGKNMIQTTSSGSGWRFFSDPSTATLSGIGYDDYFYNFDHVYYSFDGNNTLHVEAKPKTNYTNVAVGANCNVADSLNNTSYVSLDKNDKLEEIGIVAAKSDYDAQFNVNNGVSVPSVLIYPSKTTYFKYYVGATTNRPPYQDTSIPDESKIIEGDLPAVRLSWTNVTDNINFDISVGDATTNGILKPVVKTGNSNTYSVSSTIKTLRLTSDDSLITEAKKSELGDVDDKVEVQLRFGSALTAGRSAISNALPKYNKTSTSTSTTGSTTSATSSTSTSYTAEYFDVNVKSYKNDDTKGVTLSEIDNNVVIEIAYNFEKKEDIRVYRYHDSSVSELSNSTSGADGTYRIDKDAGKIYVYTRKFSTYGVAYKPENYYTVTFNDGTNKWTVNVKEGEKVSAPESMPTKNGVTAQFWYKATSTSSSTSTTSSTKPTAYDFNTPVTANMTLTAYYGKPYTVTFSGITPTTTVQVSEGDKVARPADPVKEGYTFKGWYSDKTAKTLYNFDTPVTKDLTLYAGFVNGEGKDADDEEEEGDVNGARAARTNDTLPPVWLWVLILVSALVVFSCNLYSRAKEGKVKFSNNKTVRKITRFFLLVGLVIVTVVKFLARKVNEKRRDLALAVSGVVVLIAAGVLIVTSLEYHRSERTYEKANKTFVQETQQLPVVTDKTETVNAENTVWWDEASVEMDTLSEEYPDVIGWIYFENEDISYPIMYSGDNTKYLSTSYNGEKAKAGAIFLDGESTPDFSDPHSLIYGHNMRDLSMFGKLRYYKTDASYYDEHQYFQVFTKDGVYRYQIFAYEEVPDNHDVFWVYGKNPEGMWEMLQDIEGGSFRKTGIEATESDHVITLATCTSKEDRRLIVSAVRTDEHDYEFVASN